MDFIDEIKWSDDALVPVIAQDIKTQRVVMFAWMNHEALRQTVKSGYAVYWSRSRKRLWKKGETSGELQKVVQMRLDCDGDAILMEIELEGGTACHTGRASCFYRALNNENWETVDPVIKSPAELYGDTR